MQETLKKEKTFQEKLSKLKKMPDDMDLNREIAILYIQRHQIEKAEPIHEKMPDDVKLNNEFAMMHLNKGQIEKALPYTQKVFDKDPDNTMGLLPDLHLKVGITYGLMIQNSSEEDAVKNGKNAILHFQSVIEKYPDSKVFETAQYYLGVTYSLTGEYKKSIELLEKLMNHTTDARMKQNAQSAIQRVKQLAAEADTTEDDN